MSYLLCPRDEHLTCHVERIKKIEFSPDRYYDEYRALPIVQWLENNIGKMYPISNKFKLLGEGWCTSRSLRQYPNQLVHIVNDTDSKLITEFILRFV